ncbi:MAG: 16S rRNA (cytosine(1402)-N(4))-methyltransferase RsmH [Candidatus Colwellbacteria bacterium]|nr:16S rRNA (cytosine(1402)-N(4))-methyltransferase RsmH [Candidatus Colwellbacteria bacterium]
MAHVPVLLKEVLEMLDPHPGEVMVDATLGAAGHGLEIAKKLVPGGSFVGIDWDWQRLQVAKEVMEKEDLNLKKLVLVEDNYAKLEEILKDESLGKIDGLLLDLGFSSDQLAEGRGFAFKGEEEPLEMTYNRNALPAYQLLPQLGQQKLIEIIRQFSDERYAPRIAKAIITRRHEGPPIVTNKDLAEVIRRAVPKNYERGRIDPATRTFMALRMYINGELDNIQNLLASLGGVMNSGGRVVIISYHSKEDTIIKSFFKEMAWEGKVKLLNKKVIKASKEELGINPRSRSAKLRAIKIQ